MRKSLLATLNNLTTRRSQKTKAISACVNKAIPWVLDSTAGEGSKGYMPLEVANEEQKAIREQLVVALRDITDGKIFLEAERARLTRALAIIKVRSWNGEAGIGIGNGAFHAGFTGCSMLNTAHTG